MTKSGKHKRRKKQDFAKVRLKVGKKLPKGDNITNTNFKSRKIILKDQLPTFSSETEKLENSLKDCLSQLSHHNSTAKKDSLLKLKTIIDNDLGKIEQTLDIVVPRLSMVMSDEDKGVREALHIVFKHLLKKVPDVKLSVFYPVIFVYIGSALTHINVAIQKSGLDLLALVLELAPPSVIAQNQSIFPKILNLLGCPSSSTDLDKSFSIGSMKKSTNGIGSIQRTILLQHVKKFLSQIEACSEKIVDHKPPIVYIERQTPEKSSLVGMQQKMTNLNYELEICDNVRVDMDYLSPNGLKILCAQLFPVLLAEWCCCKSDFLEREGIELSLENMKAHHYLVDIVISLLSIAKQLKSREDIHEMQEWLLPKFNKEVLPVLMKYFPYQFSQNIMNKKKKRLFINEADQKTGERLLNLKLCHITLWTMQRQNENVHDGVRKYILDSIKDRDHKVVYLQNVILIITKLADRSNNILCSENHADRSLVAEIIKGYDELSDKAKLKVVQTMYNLYKMFKTSVNFDAWIKSLPKLLTLSLSSDPAITISVILELLRSENSVVIKNMTAEFPKLLGTLKQKDSSGEEVRKIISMVFWLPKTDELTTYITNWAKTDISETSATFSASLLEEWNEI